MDQSLLDKAADDNKTTRIEFSESMNGFASVAQTTFKGGFAAGKKAGSALSIHVTVLIEDLAFFLQDCEHAGKLNGQIESPLLGGVCQVSSGVFRLLPDTADLDRKVMCHQLYATTLQHTTAFISLPTASGR